MTTHQLTMQEVESWGTDAQKWAEGFMKVLSWGVEVDEGLMTSWFANAFGAQERVDTERAELLLARKNSILKFFKEQGVDYP